MPYEKNIFISPNKCPFSFKDNTKCAPIRYLPDEKMYRKIQLSKINCQHKQLSKNVCMKHLTLF